MRVLLHLLGFIIRWVVAGRRGRFFLFWLLNGVTLSPLSRILSLVILIVGAGFFLDRLGLPRRAPITVVTKKESVGLRFSWLRNERALANSMLLTGSFSLLAIKASLEGKKNNFTTMPYNYLPRFTNITCLSCKLVEGGYPASTRQKYALTQISRSRGRWRGCSSSSSEERVTVGSGSDET